jgi:DNA polymerase-3 subunit alpha
MFGEDYYIEIQRHDIKEQEIINANLTKICKEIQCTGYCHQ